ncbi:CGNR zinc finger domain-containing protein [Cryobacterium sp. SO1]|uniref:CGNR zinc finger domain-containing protein n=1 Tax=Cryobacterium sp. SO1 TaxID=1897061 RepID=UPI0010D340B9|nr:CGNR zinc finger domain-containing protein [Cryobacterium sp. SO1]RZI34309.1 hypothetical protein BJQ95_03450 [Cryobacterium sp. SO1]
MTDEDLLLAVLNSAPVVDGSVIDELDGVAGGTFARRLGGSGSSPEVSRLRRVRAALHAVIRNPADADVAALAAVLNQVVRTPQVTLAGVRWEVRAPAEDLLAVRVLIAWSDIVEKHPGRLRPCANVECNLFLVDHSRPGSAKWCSMTTCGNRMKARAYARRTRSA